MLIIQYVTIAGVAVAIFAMILKVVKYATAPEHMRWELYPVPHEKGRAEYGGSYLEELDWWTKPRQVDRINELKEMASEILLLKGVFHHNKRVWRWSLPFHLGLYLSVGWLCLLLLGAIMMVFDAQVSAEAGLFGQIVHGLTVVTGYAGLGLATLGALGLLSWRMSDAAQRRYNAPIDYLNLVLFIIACSVALVAQIQLDPGFAALRGYVHATVTLQAAIIPGTLFAVEIVLVSFLVAWICVTRMSHFVAKYFLYHAIRWNDEPNVKNSALEKRLIALLGQKVGWSASHIQTGESWADVATKEVNQ